MEGPSIRFPNLGIEIARLETGISIFGFRIAFYGIIIGIGMICGILLACHEAKRTKQDPNLYFDYAIYAIIVSIICARIYYVIFSWDYYKQDLLQIFNIRGGGLAIYGGVIGAVLTLIVYSKLKKKSFWGMADIGVLGLLLGQAIGRWGNFVNREAFGSYTDNLFAMQIRMDEAAYTTPDLMAKAVEVGKAFYIQVHPTFLYESLWNLALLILLLIYHTHKRFDGEVFLMYLAGYGLGRLWIEGLRTDQLKIPLTSVPVSQVLAGVLFVGAGAAIVIHRLKKKKTA